MAQIQTATASVTHGSDLVVASAGNDWSQAVVNGLFIVNDVYYIIKTVSAPGSTLSGRWEIELTVDYEGSTNATATYAIHTYFTPYLALPLPTRGDIEVARLCARAFSLLDSFLASATLSGAMPFVPQTFSVALTTSIIQTKTFTFSTPRPDISYVPVVVIENTVDTNVLRLGWVITAKSTTAFSVKIVDAPDSSNYTIRAYA